MVLATTLRHAAVKRVYRWKQPPATSATGLLHPKVGSTHLILFFGWWRTTRGCIWPRVPAIWMNRACRIDICLRIQCHPSSCSSSECPFSLRLWANFAVQGYRADCEHFELERLFTSVAGLTSITTTSACSVPNPSQLSSMARVTSSGADRPSSRNPTSVSLFPTTSTPFSSLSSSSIRVESSLTMSSPSSQPPGPSLQDTSTARPVSTP